MDACLLDTDILSEVLKQRHGVVALKSVAYLSIHTRFTFSAMSRYEVRRGYLAKNALQTLVRFEAFCQQSLVLPISNAVLDCAATLWVEVQRGGHPCGDADLVIAATALESNLALVTGNTPHFTWVSGLRVENWRIP